MTSPAYLTTCPNCGAPLTPHAGAPSSAPWQSFICDLGFFACELQPNARSAWRAHHRDWGYGMVAELDTARRAELADAHTRGTSIREDQIGLLDDAQLAHLASDTRVAPAIKSAVAAAQKQRGH